MFDLRAISDVATLGDLIFGIALMLIAAVNQSCASQYGRPSLWVNIHSPFVT